jgi:hypothetical protein
MTYDWEGYRTRRARLLRFASALAVGLAVPVAITAWQIYLS